MTGVLYAATLAGALGCGLVAGVFFTWSTFGMPGLADLPAAQGIAAMQSINRKAITPLFMAALFGTALICLGLVVWAVVSWDEREAPWVAIAGALYVVGTIAVTMVRNVPMNDALAALDADRPESAAPWAVYLAQWTAWNHVRGAAALVAAGLLTVALALG